MYHRRIHSLKCTPILRLRTKCLDPIRSKQLSSNMEILCQMLRVILHSTDIHRTHHLPKVNIRVLTWHQPNQRLGSILQCFQRRQITKEAPDTTRTLLFKQVFINICLSIGLVSMLELLLIQRLDNRTKLDRHPDNKINGQIQVLGRRELQPLILNSSAVLGHLRRLLHPVLQHHLPMAKPLTMGPGEGTGVTFYISALSVCLACHYFIDSLFTESCSQKCST